MIKKEALVYQVAGAGLGAKEHLPGARAVMRRFHAIQVRACWLACDGIVT
jgi:hypothetical protein